MRLRGFALISAEPNQIAALLIDEWSIQTCAAWGNTSNMPAADGTDSLAYKRKLEEVEKAANKKALKRRMTNREQADV
jgi:hypothetical protein